MVQVPFKAVKDRWRSCLSVHQWFQDQRKCTPSFPLGILTFGLHKAPGLILRHANDRFSFHTPLRKASEGSSVSLIAALNKSQPEAQRHILKPVTAFAAQICTFLYMKITCKGKTVNLRQHEKLQHPLQAFKEMLHYRVGRKGLYTFPWFIFNYF